MFHHFRRLIPMAPWRRFLIQQQNPGSVTCNFWSLARPPDIRKLVRAIERLEQEFDGQSPSRNRESLAIPIQGVVQSGDVYRINVDAHGFKPEEINISLKDNILTIRAKLERKTEDGGRLQQEFTREVILPENVDTTALKSFLGHDGVLTIVASYKPDAKPQEISVNRS